MGAILSVILSVIFDTLLGAAIIIAGLMLFVGAKNALTILYLAVLCTFGGALLVLLPMAWVIGFLVLQTLGWGPGWARAD